MDRLIYVTDDGDDLEGDGTPENPFLTEDRAELDAQSGDVILIFDANHPLEAPGVPRPPSWGTITRYLNTVVVGAVGVFLGITFMHNPALAALITSVVACIVVAVFDE